MKRLLIAIACIFIMSPTYAQVQSAGELIDSCKSLQLHAKGKATEAQSKNSRLCIWVFAMSLNTYQHMLLEAIDRAGKGKSVLSSCRSPDILVAVDDWLSNDARALERDDKIAIATTSVAQHMVGYCKQRM
jgi:hypothetical protein